MKKLFFISGVLVLAFGILFITGILDFGNTVGRAFSEGNRLYAEDELNAALEAYHTGLQKEPGNSGLNYNAGQVSYRLNSYEQAIEYYGKSSGTADSYLNRGNSAFRLGEGTEDINQKIQYFTTALEAYKEGILAFPQSVELKYNYEFVMEKLNDLQQSMENQQQNEDQQDQDQNEQQQENQGNNEEGQQDSEQSNPAEDQQESEQNPQDQGDENPNGEDNPQQDNTEEQQAGSSGQDEQQEEQQASSSGQDEQQEEQNNEAPSDAVANEQDNPSGTAADDIQSDAEIERILEMLEKQEADSLKNNQQIINSGKEDEHDW